MSILVVDDSEDARVVLESYLRACGYRDITTADCVEEAYGVLGLSPSGDEATVDPTTGANPVKLILMDISMAETDGLEACRRIKESERLRKVPVIFVTGQTDPTSVRAAFQAGAADFIAKPVRKADLEARMQAVLGAAPQDPS
jgi:phosphoserine phosphatase RsbU/P